MVDAARRSWLIWSEEHGAWWKAGRAGYTRSMREAGRYPLDEAAAIVDDANRYAPISEVREVLMPDLFPGSTSQSTG
jgi:hypothetical protein